MKIPRRIAARLELLRATAEIAAVGVAKDELLALADDIEKVFEAFTDFHRESSYSEHARQDINANLFESEQRRAAHSFVNLALNTGLIEYRELSRETPNLRTFRHTMYLFDPNKYRELRKDNRGIADEVHEEFDADREKYLRERGRG